MYFRNNKEIRRLKSIIKVVRNNILLIRMSCLHSSCFVEWLLWICSNPRCNPTSQQVRGQVSWQGPYEQPVALRRQLAFVVTIRAIEAPIVYVWPRPGRYTEPGAVWPTRVPDPGAVWSICVPEPRNPFPRAGVSRWKIRAGISPSSAIKYWAALFGPHAVSGSPPQVLCAL